MSLRRYPDHCEAFNWSGTAGTILTGASRLCGFSSIDATGSAGAVVVSFNTSAAGVDILKVTATVGQVVFLEVPVLCNNVHASASGSLTGVQFTVFAVDDRKG
jgi:hypothetical protein